MTETMGLAGELGSARLALLDVLARVPDDGWTAQTWGVREVLAHLAAWDEVSALAVQAARDLGEPPPPVHDDDAFNAAAAAEFAALSPVQALVRLHAARARLVAVVSRRGELGEFEMPWGGMGDLAQLVLDVADHEREHTALLAQQWPAPAAGQAADNEG